MSQIAPEIAATPQDSLPPRLLLPPPFVAHRAGAGDILDLACAQAEQGAGTLLWRAEAGVLAFAVILEPSAPLITTTAEVDLAFYASLAASCDSLAQHGPPERPLRVVWPDQITYDGARLAGARLRQGPVGSDGLPQWLAYGCEVILAREGLEDSGLYPQSTALMEEGFPEPAAIVESFAAYLKLIVDRWSQEGPDAVLRRLLNRVESPTALAGARIEQGRLRLPPLAPALNEGAWRDAARGGPAW